MPENSSDKVSKNEDAWDAIAFDPHAESFQEGSREGHEAGLKAGFQEGRVLGQTKGLEFHKKMYQTFSRDFIPLINLILGKGGEQDLGFLL